MKIGIFKLVLIFIVLGLVVVIGENNYDLLSQNDFRIGVLADDGIALVSISPSRGMINVLKIGREVMVWLPGEYGWYRSDRVKKLLVQDNKLEVSYKMFLLNFGFWPGKLVMTDKIDKWEDWGNLVSQTGWIKAILIKRKMMGLFFDEYVNESQLTTNLELDQVLTREFGDNSLINEGLLISVFNNSGINQLASFFSRNLIWMGLNVVEVADWMGRDEGCSLKYSRLVEKTRSVALIKKVFESWPRCLIEMDTETGDTDIKIVLDKTWAEMVNYDNYVRAF